MRPQSCVKPPTSQPITLISPEMCFSFAAFPPHGGTLHAAGCREERKSRGEQGRRGCGGIYLNNLVVMKAAKSCWGWIDGARGEKSGEERVYGVKLNCGQIVGHDNGLNRASSHTSVCVHIHTNIPCYSHKSHMLPLCAVIYLPI